MADSKLRDLSTDFAVKVIKLCDSVKGHYSLVNQLERSSTSIGANIHEANYAHSKADFIAKFQIALKECYETEYWIELFVKAIPKVLFSHFAKINAFEAKVLFVVSLVMALLCMNDVIENKER